jgi:dihydrofolate reductase
VIVSLIVAMDENGGIAYQGRMPWHLPAELKLFKHTTHGHHLLMGRKTFETVGKPLPGRTTIVITRQPDYRPQDCLVAHSLQEGLGLAQSRGETEAFVCGGGEIYALALPLADRLYLTVVHTTLAADITFPKYRPEEWQETGFTYHPADGNNPYAFTRYVYERKPALESAGAT